MRNVLSGDFTARLIKDDDNSVKELQSLSNRKFQANALGFQDPRYAANGSKGNSNES